MLKRIHKITNIGRFSDCCVPGCEFGDETIIFGFNTQGKSTLTAILRSLQTGNSDILIGRKTFGATTPKGVVIDFEEGNNNEKYTFQNKAWNKINENVLIFDSRFITENVFDGESITFDQQKNLNTVIIGKKGQELSTAINKLQEQSEAFAKQKTEKTRQFSQNFSNFDIEKFKALKKNDDIDSRISDNEREIKFERDREEIKKLIRAHTGTLSSIRFSIRDTFAKTLDSKHEEIEKHIKAHFSTAKNAESFLSEGLDLLKEKQEESLRSCVFCGQELNTDAENLISIYSSFFKGGYAVLQKEVADDVTYFRNINVEALLEKIASDLKARNLDINLDEARIAELVALKRSFEAELDKKRDLNYPVDFTSFDALKAGLEDVKSALENLEKTKINIASPKNISQLEMEKKLLEITKKRYEPVWDKFCSDLDAIETDAEKVRTEREEKRKELDAYSTAIFDTHKDTINLLCKEMGADFEIADFKPLKRIVGRSERIFAIKFFGAHKVNIDNEDEKSPNFKNTLSESDKRLLAFAFFVSLLMHDRDLNTRIIVFDDPMSSFDSERRRKTVQIITDIICKYKDASGNEISVIPRQKIVLTHEDRFAKELNRLMPKARTLKIEEYMDGSHKRSRIAHADFSQEFPDDDITHCIEKIKNILDTRSFSTPFEEDCRVVLEHIFKRKYYLDLKDVIAKKKSVRTFTTTLVQGNIGGFGDATKAQKFTRLCDDLNIELHDNSASNSNGDKESILKDFFDCLGSI